MERREFLKVTGGLAGAALLTSCARPPAAAPASPAGTPRPSAHVLFADVSDRLSALDTRSGATIFSTARPVAGAAWYRLYTVSAAGELLTLDSVTGRELSRATVPRGVVARVVSPLGDVVALGAPPPASPYGRPGRRSTTLVVADPSGSTAPKVVRLKGNFEPDAFSTDGKALFLLEYLPATSPESYRVKAYDIERGAFSPLFTREKRPVPAGAEETMRGDGRVAVLSPGRDRLYTLYTHQPNHLHTRDLVAGRTTGVHAFVHVLDLGQRWAYCLDLPEPFGRGPAEGHTLAVSAAALYVYDGGSGILLRASTESLEVERTVVVGASSGAASAASEGASLYVAAGPSVRSIDPGSLAVRGEWRLPAAARGVAVTPDERAFYAGVPGGVVRFDGRTGREVSRIAVPGISLLRHAATRPDG
ncbi:hypothetical protein AB0O34_12865 [Sphaerisporangium sp. NPDC088356]|uniref:YncE family protein n=1 Tax=Sphaerisporangium sp. NPDC088356 TaxID=3154871 RepID=UPI0034477B76